MPTTTTVFRPVKSNDVHVRPFKSYKSYSITNTSDYSGSGYRIHNALYNKYDVHVGDRTYSYPTNSIDNSNQHVIWRSIDHRYYRYPFDPSKCHELTNIRVTEKYLSLSASILTIPYFKVGERIKPGSFNLSAIPIGTDRHTLYDDGNGNLRDSLINTGSFASSSNLFFYMSFNDEFRKFNDNYGTFVTGSVKYILNNDILQATSRESQIIAGVTNSNNENTGIAIKHQDRAYIKLPHNNIFNKFNKNDDWTISFWYYVDSSTIGINTGSTLLSKYGTQPQFWVDPKTNKKYPYDQWRWLPPYELSSNYHWKSRRTPFHFELVSGPTNENKLQFRSSDGIQATCLTGSWGTSQQWHHCAVVNSNTTASLYIDGINTASGSLPRDTTSNTAYVMVGNFSYSSSLNIPIRLDEIRMYDYAVTATELASLKNNHYLSGSLYQTNVAGNIFYRNGQVVISSPMNKYNSGSGFFRNQWTASWQGTHTIYENEVMVRVPADQLNHSLNPTATYRPASNVNSNGNIEKYNGSGPLFKSMFTSSYVSPYITTIGLYNDQAQLLAIGKLAQPVQKRDDVDMNIIVRWDY